MPGNPLDSFIDELPLEELRGLSPSARICVGSGFSSEEIKSELLKKIGAFFGDAVVTSPQLALKLTEARSEQLLDAMARQEVLRLLFSERKIRALLPALDALKRQSPQSFWERLDRALQESRLSVAHDEEQDALIQHLDSLGGSSAHWRELRLLCAAYEAWLEEKGHLDYPMLLTKAIHALERGDSGSAELPQKVIYFSAQTPRSREALFWQTLSLRSPLIRVGPLEEKKDPEKKTQWAWERWHTLDDAAEGLAEALRGAEWGSQAILVENTPAVRRSLERALQNAGIPTADSRDPFGLRRQEAIKSALLPFQAFASRFDRRAVIAWIQGWFESSVASAWVEEIHSRGMISGRVNYRGGVLEPLFHEMERLEESFGGKKTMEFIATAHLRLLEKAGEKQSQFLKFWEIFWERWRGDLDRVGSLERPLPLMSWMERLRSRLSQTLDLPPLLKPEDGIAIHQLHQAPLKKVERVWFFGFSPLGFSPVSDSSVSEDWLNPRDRERLAAEYSIRSTAGIRKERLAHLSAWLNHADSAVVVDAHYHEDGRERESLLPSLLALAEQTGVICPEHPEERGAHDRWRLAYGRPRLLQPQTVSLAAVEPESFSATAVDHYSRCAFLALGFDRWKLKDLREAGREPWPEVRGSILHQAVRELVSSYDGAGKFALPIEEALERAWGKTGPKGLLRSDRLRKNVRARWNEILSTFAEKDLNYLNLSQARPLLLDEGRMSLEIAGTRVVGRPDRIDELPTGLLVIDYKTSTSAAAHGSEMLELGDRLQLPFYAVAIHRQMNRAVIGAQFIELNPTAGRSRGFFFKGLEAPFKIRSHSKSLLSVTPEQALEKFESHLQSAVKAMRDGIHHAHPKNRDRDCPSCPMGDLCGYRRAQESMGANSDV